MYITFAWYYVIYSLITTSLRVRILTGPVSEVMGGPGEVVGDVEAILGSLVVGIVQNG